MKAITWPDKGGIEIPVICARKTKSDSANSASEKAESAGKIISAEKPDHAKMSGSVSEKSDHAERTDCANVDSKKANGAKKTCSAEKSDSAVKK